eukprot:3835426-Rhodomonas_salina.1
MRREAERRREEGEEGRISGVRRVARLRLSPPARCPEAYKPPSKPPPARARRAFFILSSHFTRLSLPFPPRSPRASNQALKPPPVERKRTAKTARG